jgi:hypothetical protein
MFMERLVKCSVAISVLSVRGVVDTSVEDRMEEIARRVDGRLLRAKNSDLHRLLQTPQRQNLQPYSPAQIPQDSPPRNKQTTTSPLPCNYKRKKRISNVRMMIEGEGSANSVNGFSLVRNRHLPCRLEEGVGGREHRRLLGDVRVGQVVMGLRL